MEMNKYDDEQQHDNIMELVRAIVEIENGKPSHQLLGPLFGLLVNDGSFDIQRNFMVAHPSALPCIVGLLSYSPVSVQAEILSTLNVILEKSVHNLEVCSRQRMFSTTLTALTMCDDDMVANKILALLQLLGRYDISVHDLRQLLTALKLDDGGFRPRYSMRLLATLREMYRQHNGPDAYFHFPNGLSQPSGITIPSIQQWPQQGFTFNSWLRREDIPPLPVSVATTPVTIFAFHTSKCSGYACYLFSDKILVETAPGGGKPAEQHVCPVKLEPNRWYMLTVAHKYRRFHASEICIYVNGKPVSRGPLKYVSLSEGVTRNCVGGWVGNSGPTPLLLAGRLPTRSFTGQMGAIYVFSDFLSDVVVAAIHSLGATYHLMFTSARECHYPVTPTAQKLLFDGKLSHSIYFSYNATAVERQLCIESSPLRNSTCFAYTPHATLDRVKPVTTRSLENSINSVGGIQVFFPLIPLLNAPLRVGYDSIQNPSSSGQAIFSLISDFLCGSVTYQQQMVLSNGFSMIARLLEEVHPEHMTLETLEVLLDLARSLKADSREQKMESTVVMSSDGNGEGSTAAILLREMLDSIFFNPKLWIYTPYVVQVRLWSAMASDFANGEVACAYLRRVIGVQRILDILLQFYWVRKHKSSVSADARERDNSEAVHHRLSEHDILQLREYVVLIIQQMVTRHGRSRLSQGPGSLNSNDDDVVSGDSGDRENAASSGIMSFEVAAIVLHMISAHLSGDYLTDILRLLVSLMHDDPGRVIVHLSRLPEGMHSMFVLMGGNDPVVRVFALKMVGLYIQHCTGRTRDHLVKTKRLFTIITRTLMTHCDSMDIALYNTLFEIISNTVQKQLIAGPHPDPEPGTRLAHPEALVTLFELVTLDSNCARSLRSRLLSDLIMLFSHNKGNRDIFLLLPDWQTYLFNILIATLSADGNINEERSISIVSVSPDDSNLSASEIDDRIIQLCYTLFRIMLNHVMHYVKDGYRVLFEAVACISAAVKSARCYNDPNAVISIHCSETANAKLNISEIHHRLFTDMLVSIEVDLQLWSTHRNKSISEQLQLRENVIFASNLAVFLTLFADHTLSRCENCSCILRKMWTLKAEERGIFLPSTLNSDDDVEIDDRNRNCKLREHDEFTPTIPSNQEPHISLITVAKESTSSGMSNRSENDSVEDDSALPSEKESTGGVRRKCSCVRLFSSLSITELTSLAEAEFDVLKRLLELIDTVSFSGSLAFDNIDARYLIHSSSLHDPNATVSTTGSIEKKLSINMWMRTCLRLVCCHITYTQALASYKHLVKISDIHAADVASKVTEQRRKSSLSSNQSVTATEDTNEALEMNRYSSTGESLKARFDLNFRIVRLKRIIKQQVVPLGERANALKGYLTSRLKEEVNRSMIERSILTKVDVRRLRDIISFSSGVDEIAKNNQHDRLLCVIYFLSSLVLVAHRQVAYECDGDAAALAFGVKTAFTVVAPFFREILRDHNEYLKVELLGPSGEPTHVFSILEPEATLLTFSNLFTLDSWKHTLKCSPYARWQLLQQEGDMLRERFKTSMDSFGDHRRMWRESAAINLAHHHQQFRVESDNIINSTLKQESDRLTATKAHESRDVIIARRQWKKMLHEMVHDCGIWSSEDSATIDGQLKDTKFFRLDTREDRYRRRLRLLPNPFGSDHADAILDDTSQTSTPSKTSTRNGEPKLDLLLKSLHGTKLRISPKKDGIESIDGTDTTDFLPDPLTENTETIEPVVSEEDLSSMKVLHALSCIMITPGLNIEGTLSISKDALLFLPSPQSLATDNPYRVYVNDLYGFRHALDDIVDVCRRRYNLRPRAFEIFLCDGTTILLCCNSDADFNVTLRFIIRGRSRSDSIGKQLGSAVEGMGKRLLSRVRRSGASSMSSPERMFRDSADITLRWQQREISNFEYLMHLNTLAGRTLNDLSQYPVFPWILSDYSSSTIDLKDPSIYRDLSKPIGALNPSRLETFKERYSSWDDPDVPPFYYGSHYSTAGYVLFYLMRLEPFTTLFLNLQGGHFDFANRCFYSLEDTWRNVLESTSDVKELIPEMYYLPELFMNSNGYRLGITDDGKAVDDVILPPWSGGSADEFIRIHRAALEGEYVSAHLHEWIDLIFGFKQSGDDAIDAYNAFYYLTYADSVDIDTIEDPVLRKAVEQQIASFGQTPTRLLNEPHPCRLSANDMIPSTLSTNAVPLHSILVLPLTQGVVVSYVSQPTSLGVITVSSNQIYGIHKISENGFSDTDVVGPSSKSHSISNPTSLFQSASEKLVKAARNIGNDPIQYDGIDKKPDNYSNGSNFTIEVDPSLLVSAEAMSHRRLGKPFTQSLATCSCCYRVTGDGRMIICGGYWDNSVKLYNSESGRLLQSLHSHRDVVTCVDIDIENRLIATGSKDSTVLIWQLIVKRQHATPVPSAICYGHHDSVRCVALSSSLRVFMSGAGSKVLMHNINGDFLYSFKQPAVAVMQCSLVSVSNAGNILVHFSDAHTGLLAVYTANARLLISCTCDHYSDMSITALGDYVVIGGARKCVEVRTVSNLERVHVYAECNSAIRSIALTKDEHHILIGITGSLVVYGTDFYAWRGMAALISPHSKNSNDKKVASTNPTSLLKNVKSDAATAALNTRTVVSLGKTQFV